MNEIVKIFHNFLVNENKHSEHKSQISFDCPRCSEEKGVDGDGKGKLEINYAKGFYKCWVCADTHNTKGFIEKLIKGYGTKDDLNRYRLLKPDFVKEDYNFKPKINPNLKLPKEYLKFKGNEGEYGYYNSLKYLKDRNIDETMIDKYNIGFINSGLYKHRVIIPSYDFNGNLNYYVTRSIYNNIKPKYLNPDIDKDYIIFNEKFLNYDSTIIIVEGVFDHIVTPNSIPVLGKTLSNLVKHNLLEKANSNIIILLDDDAYENAILIYNELNVGRLEGKIRICNPPVGYDVAKIYEKLGNKGIIKLIRNC
jgi:DNA primase